MGGHPKEPPIRRCMLGRIPRRGTCMTATALRPMAVMAATTLLAFLSACGGGPVKRVSQPAASIQQLTVRTDGSWSVDLRLDNYSSVGMRFDATALAVTVGGESAG